MRSFVAQGKVVREPRTGRLSRESPRKKMTVEMERAFVWPEVPGDLAPWRKEEGERGEEAREMQRRRLRPDERHRLEPEDAQGVRERARKLLGGKVRWRPSWEQDGGATAVAMGREA